MRDATITRLHRLERTSPRRFEDAIFLLVSRGVWDLDELELAYERRRAFSPVTRERRRLAMDRAVERIAVPVG